MKKIIIAFLKRLFCTHSWEEHAASGRYSIINPRSGKVGEVTLTVLDCTKCGKSVIIPSDRTHIS